MRVSLRRTIKLALLATALSGCGNSGDTIVPSTAVPNNSPPTTLQARLDQALLADPARAVQLVPTDHLNPLGGGAPKGDSTAKVSVSTLESDYEILFGSLSESLGVTLTTPQVAADIRFIACQPGTGFFDLNKKPILNNPLGVTDVSFQALEYDTTVPLPGGDRTFHVSGGLLTPDGIDKSKVKGVLVYFHGTTFNNSQVPSHYEGNVETELMAEVFASQGYIVVMPDYIGQGVDYQDVHPYVLYPKVSAQTAVDMLKAVKPRLITRYGILPGDKALKLFSVGYSEGGSYSLWFNQYLSSNPGLLDSFYQLTHSVGLEGAYSTSEVIFGYLFEDVTTDSGNKFNIQTQAITNVVKPLLSADAFLSYATYSLASDFGSVFYQEFFDMKATLPVRQSECNINGVQVNVAQAFSYSNTTISGPLLYAGLGKTNNGKTYLGLFGLLTSSNNSVRSLVSSTLLTQAPLAALLQVLVSADSDLSAVASGGVSIVSLDQDSVVSPNNFDKLLAKYPSKIKNAYKIVHTDLQILAPFSPQIGQAVFVPTDHLHALIYEFLYALNTFNEF